MPRINIESRKAENTYVGFGVGDDGLGNGGHLLLLLSKNDLLGNLLGRLRLLFLLLLKHCLVLITLLLCKIAINNLLLAVIILLLAWTNTVILDLLDPTIGQLDGQTRASLLGP